MDISRYNEKAITLLNGNEAAGRLCRREGRKNVDSCMKLKDRCVGGKNDSMTGSALRCTGSAEQEIANGCTDTHGNHDEAIVCHKEKPARGQLGSTGMIGVIHMMKNE